MAITELRVGHQQGEDAVGAGTLRADPQRIPESVRLAVRVVERDAVLTQDRDQRVEHVRAGREEHHRLSLLQMLHGALEDEILRRLVGAAREPLYRAIFRSRQVDLLLASRDPMDQIVGELVDGAGNPMRLFEDDLVVLRNVRIEDGVRGSARERKDGLVVVTRKNEVVRAARPISG